MCTSKKKKKTRARKDLICYWIMNCSWKSVLVTERKQPAAELCQRLHGCDGKMDILYDYNVYSSKDRINLHKQGRRQRHRGRGRECWGFMKTVKAQRSHLHQPSQVFHRSNRLGPFFFFFAILQWNKSYYFLLINNFWLLSIGKDIRQKISMI